MNSMSLAAPPSLKATNLEQLGASYLMNMKRKTIQQPIAKYTKNSSNLCMLTRLPDTILLVISSYSDPRDIYNLAQTCKKFHTPSTELSTRHFLSPPESRALEFTQNNVVTNVASRLLQESLVQGFLSVMQSSDAAISINQTRALVKFQVDEYNKGRRVLLSGSTAVQVATGKRFKHFDLDFFCNRRSAPGFRKLMRDFGFCCKSVLPHYGEHADCDYHSCEPRVIHHIETYIHSSGIETIAISKLVSKYYRAWNAQLAAAEGDGDVPPENVNMSFLNYRNLCLHKIQRNVHKFANDYPIALSSQQSLRNELKHGIIELVVCRTRPEHAIARFDMNICKCNFDGKMVEIVSMNDTFNSRTKSDYHIEFINCYVPYFLSGVESNYTNALAHISDTEVCDDMLLHIMQCVINTANDVDMHTQVTVLGTDNFRLLNSGSNLDYTPRYCLALHNKIVRLLKRALKYTQRGIDVPLSDTLIEMLLGTDTVFIYNQRVKRARH
jgi:hypothetical protein